MYLPRLHHYYTGRPTTPDGGGACINQPSSTNYPSTIYFIFLMSGSFYYHNTHIGLVQRAAPSKGQARNLISLLNQYSFTNLGRPTPYGRWVLYLPTRHYHYTGCPTSPDGGGACINYSRTTNYPSTIYFIFFMSGSFFYQTQYLPLILAFAIALTPICLATLSIISFTS